MLLQPLKVYVKWIMLAGATSSIHSWHRLLRDRSRPVMLRSNGLMRDAHSLIQRFNPSVRAARRFPHLPVSRLLMSLNDYDLPIHYVLNRGWSYSAVTVLLAAFLFSLVPEIFRNSVLQSIFRPSVNFIILVLASMSSPAYAVPVVVVVCVSIGYVVWRLYRNKRVSPVLSGLDSSPTVITINSVVPEGEEPLSGRRSILRLSVTRRVCEVAAVIPADDPCPDIQVIPPELVSSTNLRNSRLSISIKADSCQQ